MQFGALGDIHGDFRSARRVLERHPEVPFWVCVGVVADADGNYEGLPAPLYWIKGNNENFDLIELAGRTARPDSDVGRHAWPHPAENLFYVPNGQLMEVPWGPAASAT